MNAHPTSVLRVVILRLPGAHQCAPCG